MKTVGRVQCTACTEYHHFHGATGHDMWGCDGCGNTIDGIELLLLPGAPSEQPTNRARKARKNKRQPKRTGLPLWDGVVE